MPSNPKAGYCSGKRAFAGSAGAGTTTKRHTTSNARAVAAAAPSQVAVALTGGALLALYDPEPAVAKPYPRLSIPLALSVMLAMGLAVFSQKELSWIHETVITQNSDASLSPRYWQMGKVCEFGR